ncbi:MAG: hypothetical protein J6O62_00165 [Bacilli bacterium]|nr:hypothetical protein [Bacilli bacterium]
MTRKEYRKQTRKFEPAESKIDAKYMNEYANVHHSYEYYSALIELETAHTKMEENYNLVKDMKELAKQQNQEDDINQKHARKVILECFLEQFKKEKKLNEKIEELKKKLKNDERKNKSVNTSKEEKIDSIEEVKGIIEDTLNLVLQMKEE